VQQCVTHTTLSLSIYQKEVYMAIPEIMVGRLRIPVVAAPLFIISNPDLVIAQCKAGIVGSFPSLNARPIEMLDEWLQRITTELAEYDAANPDAPSAPFAVNQIVHRSNNRLDEDMALCEKYKVPRRPSMIRFMAGAASCYTTSLTTALLRKP
jgi:NAD(P)H-dependent flavin oxidoreductase YrpB (nitropropane dioxygenase family)